MTTFHLAGFPRVGAKRELKFAQERYWRGEISEADLLDIAKRLRELNWQHQAKANADFVAVADFTLYDHILDFLPLPACCIDDKVLQQAYQKGAFQLHPQNILLVLAFDTSLPPINQLSKFRMTVEL